MVLDTENVFSKNLLKGLSHLNVDLKFYEQKRIRINQPNPPKILKLKETSIELP